MRQLLAACGMVMVCAMVNNNCCSSRTYSILYLHSCVCLWLNGEDTRGLAIWPTVKYSTIFYFISILIAA